MTEAVDAELLVYVRTGIAKAAAAVLTLIGIPTHAADARLIMPRSVVEIANECVALDLDLLLAAAILLYPARAKAKLIGVLIAFAAVETVNFARGLALGWAMNSGWGLFDVGHVYVWPTFLILVCVATLVFWIQVFAHEER